MTKDELLSKAKYLQLPNYDRDYDKGNAAEYANLGVDILRVPTDPDPDKCLYSKELHSSDQYHYKPYYHINYVLPSIGKLLGFNFNLDDFNYVERIIRGADLSYLRPKVDYEYKVTRFKSGKSFIGKYEDLSKVSEVNWPVNAYRMQYRYPHECSSIETIGLNSGRTLFLSSDSHAIPDIPVLTTYFDKVFYMDNRTGTKRLNGHVVFDFDRVQSNYKYFEHENFTDVLIMMTSNTVNKYINCNLK